MSVFRVIVLASVFIILAVIIFNTVKSTLSLSSIGSFLISISVSMLAVIGISNFLEGSIDALLLPYAALGITILLMPFIVFITNQFKDRKESLLDYSTHKNDAAQTDNKQLQR